MKTIRTFAILFVLLNSALRVQATHMAGADLTYQYIGNNQYLVTYTFYRDCIGIPAQTSIPLQVSSFTCGITINETLLPVPGTGQLISYVCSGALTTCDGGSAPGIQEWEYTAVVTLNQPCPDWTFGVAACCRNAAITTIIDASSEEMYLEANLDNTNGPNNSPVFSNVPIAFECIGQDNYFNHGGLDVDGDSLVYSFYVPLNAPNDPLPYAPSYSTTNPITSVPGVWINSLTGDIFMHPTVPEIGVIAVKIEEYRNGVLIGSVIRDIQIYTIQCNNDLPFASGVDGTSSYSVTACAGSNVCFDILTSDPNLSDSVTILWNQGIPNSSFQFDTTMQFPVINFCWQTTSAQARPQPYFFVVTVRDNACPSNGVQSFAYTIYLTSLTASISGNNISCHGGHDGSATITSPIDSLTYIWMPGSFTSKSISHLTAGNYSVDVEDTTGCQGTFYIQVAEPAPISLSVTGTNATCSGSLGTATVLASGGTGMYSYEWQTSPPQTSPTITGLDPGTYTIVVTDENNCVGVDSVTLTGQPPFLASISSEPASCLAHDGSADVSVSGGSGAFSFDWTPNISSGSSASNLAAGVYDVTVTDDSSGCVQYLSTIVENTVGIVATITSHTNATCEGSENGTATVIATGGDDPYEYTWMPGGHTGPIVTNLAPGTYTVMASDYDGCPGFDTVTIGFDHPTPQLDLGPDTVMCIGDLLTLDAGPDFSYLWSTTSTLQSITVGMAGVYSVLITDSNGCENFDAINVSYVSCITPGQPSRFNEFSMQTWPNPSHDRFNVHFIRSENPITLRLINSLGVVLYEASISSETKTHRVDVSNYPPGMYLLVASDGESVKTAQVVRD